MAEKPTAAPAPKSSQFPPAMRAYVERAFLAAKTPEQKKAMTPALKSIIDAASAKGELWMTNWDTLPLPDIAALAATGNAAAAAAGAMESLQQGELHCVCLDGVSLCLHTGDGVPWKLSCRDTLCCMVPHVTTPCCVCTGSPGKRSRWDLMRRGPQQWEGAGRGNVAAVPDARQVPAWVQQQQERKRQRLQVGCASAD